MLAELGRSELSVKNYCGDIIQFFRFRKRLKGRYSVKKELSELDVSDTNETTIRKVKPADISRFLVFLRDEHLSSSSRARKVSALHSFFKFCHIHAGILDRNPMDGIDCPKTPHRNPKYLTLEESKELVDAAYVSSSINCERNYCIVVFFLNCGMRLAELRNIDLEDIKDNTLTVIGKGDKERTVYLTNTCMSALEDWLEKREAIITKNHIKLPVRDRSALFISRQGHRISEDAIQYSVKKLFAEIGLDTTKYSVHKLRHTAATLMYKYGAVDIRALCEILGHKSVSTTQIYTHVDSDVLRNAINTNPLANYSPE